MARPHEIPTKPVTTQILFTEFGYARERHHIIHKMFFIVTKEHELIVFENACALQT